MARGQIFLIFFWGRSRLLLQQRVMTQLIPRESAKNSARPRGQTQTYESTVYTHMGPRVGRA